MIRMCKKIGGELVVIPYKAGLDVLVDGMEIDFGKVFLEDVAVKCPYSCMIAKGFQ